VLQTLEGYTSTVNSVTFSPDGTRVVSGFDDKTVRIWDIVTGVVLQTLDGHADWVGSVAFSPDSKLSPSFQVLNYWVIEGNTNILWLPPKYWGTYSTSWNENLIIRHLSKRISFFHFKKEAKLII
jgi:WD40 repeat protein